MATLTFIYHTLTSSSSSTLRSNYRAQKQESPATLSIVNKNPNQNPILELGKKKRGVSVITRAGPSSTSYIFAFVFPLSLLAVTIFSAMRISDELDEKFLEELAINETILEGEEGDADDILTEEKPEVPRTRNRPKREVERAKKEKERTIQQHRNRFSRVQSGKRFSLLSENAVLAFDGIEL
ncbi:hypothetical protein M9H77_17693 [Catharanthus roseus]|uniref:Uncharacterized protein n=1 Tax=Catharanthus roseus TaxID=4058 RepID=A0ACC0B5B3_CATRO|nr:hypothetical protein M9H77_17693 [Catharanthus roseus]